MLRTAVISGSCRGLLHNVPSPPMIAETRTADFGSKGQLQTHAWMAVPPQSDLAPCVFVDVRESDSGTRRTNPSRLSARSSGRA